MTSNFRLYNTLTRKVEDFTPMEPGKVRIYVCGMTVYDNIHVGHARAMVIFDAFVRWLRGNKWDVHFVRNFTDVDDKIIARANERDIEPLDLANEFIDAFRRDTNKMGLITPDEEPRVSTSIGDIQDVISQLVENGNAYPAEGTVWFDVHSFDGYGKLSGQKLDEMRSADSNTGKRAPQDFALWKSVKPGEPSWESPWGPGRPGWHIECSAMSCAALGKTFDIHGGGLDLVFPHHENEIAQSECANHAPYANYWMHNGLLTMSSGKKMGKSLGNVIDVQDALENFPAETLRLYYLQSHYRSPLPWDEHALPTTLSMLARLYGALENAQEMGGQEDPDQVAKDLGEDAQTVLDLSRQFTQRFNEALDDDFNTAQAMGYLFELARAINRFAAHKKAKKRGGPLVLEAIKAFALTKTTLGLVTMDVSAFQQEVKDKRLAAMGIEAATIEDLLEQRKQARGEKNWERADEIRSQLSDLQIIVMDHAEGVDWRVALD